MIDRVATMYHCDWGKAVSLGVYEFLNIFSYSIAKDRFEISRQKAAYDQMKAKSAGRGRH